MKNLLKAITLLSNVFLNNGGCESHTAVAPFADDYIICLFELQAVFEGFAHSFVYQIIAMCIWVECNGID